MIKLFDNIKTALTIVLLMAAIQTFNSCKKDNPASSLSDIIDTQGTDLLKNAIQNAASYDDLPEEVKAACKAASSSMTNKHLEAFSKADYKIVAEFYKSNITLSNQEITELKANNVYTYYEVIQRMAKLPAFISKSEMEKIANNLKTNLSVTQYLVKTTEGPTDMYSEDFYLGVTDFQDFIKTYTIPTFEKIAEFKSVTDISVSTGINQKSENTMIDEASLAAMALTSQYLIDFTMTTNATNNDHGGTAGN